MDVAQAMKVLEVTNRSTPDQIKAAYRRLVLKYHPDKNHNDGVQFKKVTEAYRTLTDEPTTESPKTTTNTRSHSTQSRAKWGAGPTDRPPEEDWSRYTQEYEQDEKWWKKYEEKFWKEYEYHVRGGNERSKADEPEEQPTLNVMVDQSLCIGCCSCETLAADVFEINRDAKSNPKSRVKNAKGAGVNLIMNAAETCPTKAIVVDNAQTGQRLYPL